MLELSRDEYEYFLRRNLMSFVERSFYELNPHTKFLNSPHIEVLISKLESCRQGKIRRLIINLPPRSLKSLCASIAFPGLVSGSRSGGADSVRQLRPRSFGQTSPRLPHDNDEQ